MRMNRYIIILFLTLFWTSTAYSQERRSEVFVTFRVNSTQIDPNFKDNASRISELFSFLQQLQADSTTNIVSISFCGAASPEGSYEWNRQLANGRLKALEKLVRSKVEIPDSIISYDDNYIPWEHLVRQISEAEISHKQEILSIIGEKSQIVNYYTGRSIDSRILKLMKLNGGRTWKEMLRRFFSPMRNASVVSITYKHLPPPVVIQKPVTEVVIPTDTVDIVKLVPVFIEVPMAEEWGHKLYVKTNALGLGLAISNAAVEIDLCKHLSFNLPAYYSAWDYFSPTVKFRTFAIQPELRYWFSGKRLCNDGWFVGAHFGLVYYNIATDGQYRIQDHNGKSPALGGGLAIGYRLPISKNNRWKMDFSIGAGAYTLHYDKFHNYHNGLLVSTDKQTYFGIDQASISFSYMFNLGRKGGAR